MKSLMSKEYYKDLDTFEDWDAHKSVILNLVEKDQAVIERAINIVEKYHDTPRTLYTGNYNRHPLRVARILMEEFDVKNPEAVLIALCHDLGEWSDYNVKDLEKEFGAEVKAGVESLTWNQNDTWESFFQKITTTNDSDLIKIKMADKLDNNRGVAFSEDALEKQKAREKTEMILRPFIERSFPEYWHKFEESLEPLS